MTGKQAGGKFDCIKDEAGLDVPARRRGPALPPQQTNPVSDVYHQSQNGPQSISSNLAAYSANELAVISRVLISIIHASGFHHLIGEMHEALNGLCKVDGCAVYRVSDHRRGLTIAFGAGDYASYLPDVVPSASNLFNSMCSKAFNDIAFSKGPQPSLFDEDPASMFGPIVVDDRLVGVLAVLHRASDAGFVAAVMKEAVMLLEILCRADVFAQSLVLRPLPDAGAQELCELEPAGPDECCAKLTPREKEVMFLLAKGMSNKEIADRLYISSATCKHHVENILAKLHAPNRAAAVAIALAYAHEGLYT